MSMIRTSASSLGVFRILFGVCVIVQLWHMLESGAWAFDYALPAFHFQYFPLPWGEGQGEGIIFIFVTFLTLFILSVSLTLGYRTRASAALFSILWWYLLLLDRAYYLNQFYLIGLLAFLLAVTDAKAPTSVWILRAQIAIVYAFAALVKLNPEWLSGEPIATWIAAPPWTIIVITLGGALFEIALVPLLLIRRTATSAVIAATLFHLANATLFNIGIFPWLMIAATTIFLPTGSGPLAGRVGWKGPDPFAGKRGPDPFGWVLLFFFLMQLLIPLRTFLLPGPSAWTEEGRRFGWQMMLRNKETSLQLTIKGMQVPIDPRQYLSENQITLMERDPHLIAEFSRFLAREFNRHHGRTPIVTADAKASLNDHPLQPLIAPTVNLALPEANLPEGWIVPLHE